MKQTEFNVEVSATIVLPVSVRASTQSKACDLAEEISEERLERYINNGLLRLSDFEFEITKIQ